MKCRPPAASAGTMIGSPLHESPPIAKVPDARLEVRGSSKVLFRVVYDPWRHGPETLLRTRDSPATTIGSAIDAPDGTSARSNPRTDAEGTNVPFAQLIAVPGKPAADLPDTVGSLKRIE